MHPPQPCLDVLHQDGITVINFRTNHKVFSRPSVDQMGKELTTAIEKSEDLKFVVNFAGVEYMSSTVLGTLVAGLMRIAKRGGELRIACLTEDLNLLFRLTGLHTVFTICDTLEAAIKSLEKKTPRKSK